MLNRLREAQLVGPALATLAALAVLVGLGTWQLERKAWKEGLMREIAERIHEPPAPLEDPKAAWSVLGHEEYRPVTVTGRFLHEDERLVFGTNEGVAGWFVFTPLVTTQGHVLFVNRGFVPDELKDPALRKAGQIEGEVTVTGLVRHGEMKSFFNLPSDPVHHRFFWRDLDGLKASLSLDEGVAFVMPFYIDAAAEPANPGGWPKGGLTRTALSNRHLEYVLTWYGLAVTLALIFSVFTAQRLRSASNSGGV